jgi:short-subunit dehydrogenase
VLVADVATEAGWDAVGAHVKAPMDMYLEDIAPLDLLVLNVGISMGSMFSELVASRDAMRLTKKLMDVNFIGTIGPLTATLPSLLKSDVVRIAVVSSIAGLTGLPTRTVYSASKFALQGFFDALRRELTLTGRPNEICIINPGVVKTDINRLREGPEGEIKQLDLTKGYEVDVAAAIMVRAVAEGRRDLIMSTDGSVLGLLKASLHITIQCGVKYVYEYTEK